MPQELKYISYTGFWSFERPLWKDLSRLPGVLKQYENGALVLEVSLVVNDKHGQIYIDDIDYFPEISGIATDQYIKLYGIHFDNCPSMPSNADEKYLVITFRVESALFSARWGHNLIDIPDKFKGITIKSKMIDFWLPDIKANMKYDYEKLERQIILSEPKTIEIVVPKFDLSLNIVYHKRIKTNFLKQVDTLKKTGSLSIVFDVGRDMAESVDVADKITHLISIFTGVRISPEIELFQDEKYINKFHRWNGRLERKKYYPVFDILILYSDIEDDFPAILENWLSRYDNLSRIISIYDELLWSGRVSTRLALLSYIQILESIYDSVYDKSIVNKSEFRKYYKSLRESIDLIENSELRESIIDRLSHSYLKTLRQKLNDLLDQEFSEVFLMTKDRNNFIDRLIKTRNSLTHPTDKIPDDFFSLNEMFIGYKILLYLVRYHIYLLIGVKKEVIINKLNKSTDIRRVNSEYDEKNRNRQGRPVIPF